MANIYEIPLTAQPQSFFITLGGIEYRLTLQWRETVGGGWFLDIADSTLNPIISGIPLVTGADLLGQYAYLGIPGKLGVATDGDPDAVPTFTNLGSQSHLYFVAS
jgi:hypothetical protein